MDLFNSIDNQKWQYISYLITGRQMVARGNKEENPQNKGKVITRPPQESEEDSNDTLPINNMDNLPLRQRALSSETAAPEKNNSEQGFQFLRYKPIRKRNKRNQCDSKDMLRQRVRILLKKVQQLERKLEENRKQEQSCPHCHFYLTQPQKIRRFDPTPQCDIMANFSRSPSRDSVEFQKIDFNSPLMCSPDMEQKSWIFLGTVLIAMGSKVMDTDGTINVFKIVKESVDKIRRQVDKSETKLSMDFFMTKQEIEPQNRIQELGFDPFFRKQEKHGGLQLESVRVQSVEEYELYFDQKLTFNLNYDALITVMEYMKQNSSVSFG